VGSVYQVCQLRLADLVLAMMMATYDTDSTPKQRFGKWDDFLLLSICKSKI
jgi:hypothetical protein